MVSGRGAKQVGLEEFTAVTGMDLPHPLGETCQNSVDAMLHERVIAAAG
jgi:hypothetical protein